MKSRNQIIDFHSHIVPGVDDGSKSVEESLDMLKIAQESGTRKIIATPHYYLHRKYTVPYEEIEAKVKELKSLVKSENINLEIFCGQEVGYSDEILNLYEKKEISTIANTRYMLLELPLSGFSSTKVLDTVYELQIKGIVPVLAHPERYRRFMKEPELINKFIKEGFLFQLNSGSLCGDFGKEAKKLSELYVKHKIYSVFGSDGHNSKSRNTDMELGIKKISSINKKYIDEMCDYGEFILKDEEVKFPGEYIEKHKGIFSFLKR